MSEDVVVHGSVTFESTVVIGSSSSSLGSYLGLLHPELDVHGCLGNGLTVDPDLGNVVVP